MNSEPNTQEAELSDYLQTSHQMELDDAKEKAKTTRNWLLGIAGIILISELIGAYRAGISMNIVSLFFIIIEVGYLLDWHYGQ